MVNLQISDVFASLFWPLPGDPCGKHCSVSWPTGVAVLKRFFSILLRLPLYFSLARSHVDQYLTFP